MALRGDTQAPSTTMAAIAAALANEFLFISAFLIVCS
jgi:hypothetical protein